MKTCVYDGNNVVSLESLGIGYNNRGLLFGETLFTTLRTYEGRALFLTDHLNRLNQNLNYFFPDMDLNWIDLKRAIIEGIRKLIHELVRKDADISLRITLYPQNNGPIDISASPNQIRFFILASTISPALFVNKHIKITIDCQKQCGYHSPSYIKTGSYINAARSLRIAKKNGFDDIIFTNQDGYLTEGATSNLFFKKGPTIFTPGLETGILEGITRSHLIRCLNQNTFHVEEGYYKQEDLLEAEVVWLSSSVKGLRPIGHLDNKPFDNSSMRNSYIQEIVKLFENYCKNYESEN